MTARKDIGNIIGIGIAGASAVGIVAMLVKSKYAIAKPAIPEWWYGKITGYATTPGDLYDVYIQQGEQVFIWARLRGIWFNEKKDWYKFLFDNLRWYGLPVGGALIAIGHANQAGVHALGRKAPMRGFNCWGVKAGKDYRLAGKPWWVGDTKEYDREAHVYVPVEDEKWRFYHSIQEAIDNYVNILRSIYPIAHAEIFSDDPDIERYVYGLEHGEGGRRYATGAFQMADIIAYAVREVPEELAKFGYHFV